MHTALLDRADCQTAAWLTSIESALRDPERTAAALAELAARLSQLRLAPGWADFIRAFRAHPIMAALLEDPYTARSFRKPRGYAGDAVLIDLIYGSGEGEALMQKASEAGRGIYAAAMQEPGVAATRARRDFLATQIDRICLERPGAHILSIACGHLRELPLSHAFVSGRTGRIVGLDQDRRSLRVAGRSLNPGRVEFVAAPLSELIEGQLDPGRFDFIYGAGIFDYLDDATATRLLEAMLRLARPGCRLLAANFVPGVSVSGYMEAAMDWWLVYRTPRQLLNLALDLPRTVQRRVFGDDLGHLAYLELEVEGPRP